MPADPLQTEAIFVDKVFLGMKLLTETGRRNLGRISFEIRILKSEYWMKTGFLRDILIQVSVMYGLMMENNASHVLVHFILIKCRSFHTFLRVTNVKISFISISTYCNDALNKRKHFFFLGGLHHSPLVSERSTEIITEFSHRSFQHLCSTGILVQVLRKHCHIKEIVLIKQQLPVHTSHHDFSSVLTCHFYLWYRLKVHSLPLGFFQDKPNQFLVESYTRCLFPK